MNLAGKLRALVNRPARTGPVRCGAAALVLLAGAAQAQVAPAPADGTTRPQAARRVVGLFDFEEMTSNPTLLPKQWVRGQDAPALDQTGIAAQTRPGFPVWNEAELDYDAPAAKGKGSVRLPTRGGSTSLRLQAGVLPTLQNADYAITATVRTQGLTHARARLVGRFLDENAKPLPRSEVGGELMLSEGRWSLTSIEMIGNDDRAAFLEIDLLLLQPNQQPGVRPSQAGAQDLSGAVWFDEVTVVQLPRVELGVTAPGGVFVRPESPELRMDVRDLTGENLRAAVTVYDLDGNVVDRTSRVLGSGRSREPLRPRVRKLGWHRAVLTVSNDQTVVGSAYADFLWLPEHVSAGVTGADRKRFGIVADSAGELASAQLPAMAARLGIGGVLLPAWSTVASGKDPEQVLTRVSDLVGSLLDAGVEVSMAIDRVPEELAVSVRTDREDPWPILTSDQTVWTTPLGSLLEKVGPRVRTWMVGWPADDRAFWRPSLPADVKAVSNALGRYVPGPVVALPWRIDRAIPTGAAGLGDAAEFSVLLPAGTPVAQISDFAASWDKSVPRDRHPGLSFVYQSPAREEFGYAEGAASLARAAVTAWAAFDAHAREGRGPAMALATPWDRSAERRPKIQPRPELAAWSTLSRALSDRRVAGLFPVAAGVKCYILTPAEGAPDGRGGALVAWNDTADPAEAVIDAYLGEGEIRIVDLFGNSHPAEYSEVAGPASISDAVGSTGRRRNVRIPLGDAPIIIEGADPLLARFVAGVRFDPAVLKATNESHEHAIVFDNPFPSSLDVRTFIIEPGGSDDTGAKDRRWKFSPRAGRAIVPPGQSGRIPVSVSFSPAEEAGPRDFIIDLDVTADRPYGLIRVRAPVTLGIDDFALELTRTVTASGDLLVEAHVANTGKEPVDLELTASAPGLPRVKAAATQVPPGTQVIRRFPFAGAAAQLRGKRVFVSVTDPATRSRLNRSVLIE